MQPFIDLAVALGAAGVKGVLELVVATHAGMTTDEFERIGNAWFASAEHPRFNRPYIDMAYRPMVEQLGHLRANGFKTNPFPMWLPLFGFALAQAYPVLGSTSLNSYDDSAV